MRANCLEPDRLFACTSKMLEGWEEVAVVAHLAACTACREVVEGYRRLDQVLDLWQPTAPLPWFDARVRAAVTAAGQCAPSRRDHLLAGLGWSRWMALALVVIMVDVCHDDRAATKLAVPFGGTGGRCQQSLWDECMVSGCCPRNRGGGDNRGLNSGRVRYVGELLSSAQRAELRSIFPRWRRLPPDRRQQLMQGFRRLRAMSPGQR